MAWASVTVPSVERVFAPRRSWSTRIAVVKPSRTSTSGRAMFGMNTWTNVEYVSSISRRDSAAIVPNTSELLPEPETPVNTVSRRFGISMLTSLRLFTRAPCTRIRSWLSARGTAVGRVSALVAVVILAPYNQYVWSSPSAARVATVRPTDGGPWVRWIGANVLRMLQVSCLDGAEALDGA